MSLPSLHFLGHSTVRIDVAGRRVLTDPVLTRRVAGLRRVVAPLHPATWTGTDLVLVSHLHNDHLHLPSLRLLGTATRVVVPRGAGAWLRGKGFSRVDELAPGETLVDGELTVTATEARHSAHRWGPRLTHGPHAPAVGHLLTGGGSTVYAAGDTDLFPGMTALGNGPRRLDVALLPVWGWGPSLGPGHLDPARAAEAVARLRPRIAVPVHWGTLSLPGLTRLPTPLGARMRTSLVEPPRVFAAAVAAAGLDTAVPLTEPGAAVTVPSRAPAP